VSHLIRMTVLVDNSVSAQGLLAEHGLAFWIEAHGRRILFDTGQGMVLRHNASELGIDLRQTDAVVLSHGHYDHTGGLLPSLPDFSDATVYLHPEALCDRFSKSPNGSVRPVRSPIESLDWLRSRVGQVVPTPTGPVAIGEGIWLTGEIPRQTSFEDTGGDFYLDQACTQVDGVMDDQAMFLETTKGLVVVLGCAHAGVVNTLEHIRDLTGRTDIHAVLGGMHLLHADVGRLRQTIRRLCDLDVQRIGLAHCTGFSAMAQLHYELPNRCFHCVVGTRMAFE